MGAQFEPVFLEPQGIALPTEAGKLWIENTNFLIEKHSKVVGDVLELASQERLCWPEIEKTLRDEGVPTAIANGISQSQMQALINASTKNATYTAPAAFVMALTTAAPASTWTGVLSPNEAGYTGYARTATTMGAASAATPSVATNSATVTFPNCTSGTSTLLGFVMCDNATINSGAALWFGSLPSVTISTTQTPPTVATGALSLSMNITP